MELRDKAIRQIKKKFHMDVPKDKPLNIEFEQASRVRV